MDTAWAKYADVNKAAKNRSILRILEKAITNVQLAIIHVKTTILNYMKAHSHHNNNLTFFLSRLFSSQRSQISFWSSSKLNKAGLAARQAKVTQCLAHTYFLYVRNR